MVFCERNYTFCWSAESLFSSTIQCQDGIGLNHNLLTQLAGDNRFTNFHFSQVGSSRCQIFDICLTTATTPVSVYSITVDLKKYITTLVK